MNSKENKISIFKNIILIISILAYSYLVFMGWNRYLFHISYIKSILFIILIFFFLYAYGIIDNRDKTFNNNVNLYILLYFLILISVTFFIGRTDIKFYSWWLSGQYEPFHTITFQLKYGSKLSIIKNIVGNSIMLIPLSFLLMIKNKKYNNIFRQMVIILPTIIGIEILQSFTHTGSFDIDDIILNYIGTIMFTFIITRFSLIDKIRKMFNTDYKLVKGIKYLLFYLSSFLLITYIIVLYFKCF